MMTTEVPSNIFAALPDARTDEILTDLLAHRLCRIERIVSQGQTTPVDRPYIQRHDEWVLLLQGTARIAMAGVETALRPGDHMFIPAMAAHRVTFTDRDHPTVWLAVHIGEAGTWENNGSPESA